MRPLLRNVAALAVLTLLAGGALAWFARLTEEEVTRNRLEAETRVFRELIGAVSGSGDRSDPFDGAPVGAGDRKGRSDGVHDGELVLCERGLVVMRAGGTGYGGQFRLAIALGLDGSIKGVRVLEHVETPGFGDILDASSAWLDAFATDDVHAVTGATITSEAVMAAVYRAVESVRLDEMCVP